MKYKQGILFTAIGLLFLVIPEAVLFYINRDVYFINNQGGDIAIGGMILLIFTMLLIFGAFKHIEPLFSGVFSLGALLAITYFFNSILSDLFNIVLAGLIGYIGFAVFFKIAQRKFEYAKSYRTEKARIEARKEYEVGNV